MINALEMAESIRKAVKACETDPTSNMRNIAIIYRYSHQSIHNRRKEKNGSARNTFISQQNIWPIEKSVLVEYCMRNCKAGFPITIQLLNDSANELLKARDSDKIVSYH
jgi:hypothetical protein